MSYLKQLKSKTWFGRGLGWMWKKVHARGLPVADGRRRQRGVAGVGCLLQTSLGSYAERHGSTAGT